MLGAMPSPAGLRVGAARHIDFGLELHTALSFVMSAADDLALTLFLTHAHASVMVATRGVELMESVRSWKCKTHSLARSWRRNRRLVVRQVCEEESLVRPQGSRTAQRLKNGEVPPGAPRWSKAFRGCYQYHRVCNCYASVILNWARRAMPYMQHWRRIPND